MNLKTLGTVALWVAVTTPSLAEDTGDLKIRFEYGGEAMAPMPITPNKDAEYCGQHDLVSEKLLINPENKGIKNVIVYLYTGRGGSKLPEVSPKNETRVLTISQCRFEPRIVLARAGDTLKVVERDPVGHSVNMNFFANGPWSGFKRAGEPILFEMQEPEPAPIPINCNIHPWMRAYVVVLDHPFAAKSDEDGVLIIKDLPAGRELDFRVFHEVAAGALDNVMINGGPATWSRSRFKIAIEPGMNDLGTVVIPGEALASE